MKVVLFLALLVAAASAHSVDKYTVPIGVNKITNFMQKLQYMNRITGGSEVTPHSRPFQAGLFLTFPQGTMFCGGSLISPNFVMTAAHCVYDGQSSASAFEVVLGAHAIRDPANTILQSTVAIVHPGWNPSLLQNDIALIKLPISVGITNNIQTVNLPGYGVSGDSFSNYDATASGWGLESDASTSIAANLNSVVMSVMTNINCNIRYLGVIKDTHICTSGADKKSTCSGDSGGPVTVVKNGKTIQVGIVSFGLALGCEVGWPAVHTRTTGFLDWIASTAGITISP